VATFLEGSKKTDFRWLIYSHSSTNRENLEKIGRVDFEITGLTEIVKNKKTAAEHTARRATAGRDKQYSVTGSS